MSPHVILSAFRDQLAAQPSRTGSLIVTIYGDAIVPRGGSLWLGSLMEICRAFDVGEGAVRTAASRLAADGWLARTRDGRHAYYNLAAKGRAAFADATARIYGGAARAWDGRFRLSLPDEAENAQGWPVGGRTGQLAPGIAVGLSDADWLPAGIRLSAGAATVDDARRLAARAWPLAELARRYRHFLDLLGGAPAVGDPADATSLGDFEALQLRVLLIHEYRRVILRDPLLPSDVLPPDWPGALARRRCARLYRALIPGSERWLDAHARGADGPLPPPGPDFATRFASECQC